MQSGGAAAQGHVAGTHKRLAAALGGHGAGQPGDIHGAKCKLVLGFAAAVRRVSHQNCGRLYGCSRGLDKRVWTSGVNLKDRWRSIRRAAGVGEGAHARPLTCVKKHDNLVTTEALRLKIIEIDGLQGSRR